MFGKIILPCLYLQITTAAFGGGSYLSYNVYDFTLIVIILKGKYS